MSFKKVFTYNKVHCTPLSTLNQNVEYIVASTRKNISKNLNEPRSSLHVQADLHGENQTLDRVPNAQSSEKTFSHLEYSASQKRKYIENQEIVSLATTIDGIETFVEATVLCDDGENVSLTYTHPIFGINVTSVKSRLLILPHKPTEGIFYGDI